MEQMKNATVKFVTGLKSKAAIKGPDGSDLYPVSSTEYDRDNDRMLESFLDKLVDDINNRHVALYVDHGIGPHGYYSVFDKLGSWGNAVKQNGVVYAKPIYSDAPIVQDQVEALKGLFESNTPVGLSISFHEPEFSVNEKGGMDFITGETLEISPVGLQSNREAIKTLKGLLKLYQKSDDEIMTDELIIEDKAEQPEEQKAVETLDEAVSWMKENAPEAVTNLIMAAMEEDEEEEEKGEDEEDMEEDEEKSMTEDELKAFIKETIKQAIEEAKAADVPEPEPAPEQEEPQETPKPKGHAPVKSSANEPVKKNSILKNPLEE